MRSILDARVPVNPQDFPRGYVRGMPLIYRSAVDYLAVTHVAEMGLTPVAVTITGSRLRGTHTDTSDTDVLVLVAEKLPKAKTIRRDTALLPFEGQVQSIYRYAELLSTSVPYVEALRSPFLMATLEWAPFLRALRVNDYVLEKHARNFARHLTTRTAMVNRPEKLDRQLAALYVLVTTGSPLVPRQVIGDPAVYEWMGQFMPEWEQGMRQYTKEKATTT